MVGETVLILVERPGHSERPDEVAVLVTAAQLDYNAPR